ncbi:hypothetical protein [Bifidobacterium subtile]|jgi:hypothetical protein|uniref:hypothetical protein n=1 Tax=Bifidobacterium subtile TaxID=77635 RepID=UPI002F35DA99
MSLPEMTTALSWARVLNTTTPSEVKRVAAEETRRHQLLGDLLSWSLAQQDHAAGHKVYHTIRRQGNA